MTIKRWAIGVLLVFAAWIILLALVTAFYRDQKDLLFIFPAQRTFTELPNSVSIIDKGGFWVTVTSSDTGVALDAYRAGVLLVLPAGLSGCFTLFD